ncbi:MAG: site-specific DNA-methyltransferase [Alphaproteobacteria bacterium]
MPLGRETRRHNERQIRKIARSLERFGFVLPIVVDPRKQVIGGWALVQAARRLGLTEVPTVEISDLAEADVRALRLALNRLSDDAEWDRTELAAEVVEILEIDTNFDLDITGFETAEIDLMIESIGEDEDEDDVLPPLDGERPPVSRSGDLWHLGAHRLLCGDATSPEAYAHLLGDDRAQMIFTDPPYNVPIDGHVSGLGAAKHAEFAMASGEMTEEQFTAFLAKILGLLATHSVDGSIHFVCMDWRHMPELLAAGGEAYAELKNLCFWKKTNGGMGSLYRSKHELVFVFKNGSAPHINTVELGRYGRYRSNVWTYAGANALGKHRGDTLAMHPTVKPVALVADAIKDCSKRRGLILDPFAGSGTTLIAAEKTGRRCAAIEIEPRYVDLCIARWQQLSSAEAIHAETGLSFTKMRAERATEHPDATVCSPDRDMLNKETKR